MPSDFDKYLESLPSEQREKLKEVTNELAESDKAEIGKQQPPKEQSPSNLQNSYTPDPSDAGKKIANVENTGTKEGMDKYNERQVAEVKESGQTLDQHGAKLEQQTPSDNSRPDAMDRTMDKQREGTEKESPDPSKKQDKQPEKDEPEPER